MREAISAHQRKLSRYPMRISRNQIANQSQSDGHQRCGLAQQRVAQEDEESRRRGHLLADALELLGHHCEQRVNNV